MAIKFGTDGWRAVISEEFTFENVRKVAQAIADKMLVDVKATKKSEGQEVSAVVGYDTRFLSDRYAAAVSEVLAANGIKVWLAQRDAATPMISYAIVDKKTNGGIMITASHNPPRYNGIKLKSKHGGSSSPEDIKDVEARLRENDAQNITPQTVGLDEALAQGMIAYFDPLPSYQQHLHSLVNFDKIRKASLSVAVDPMYGAGRFYLADLLREAGCRVKEVRGEMNPGFNGSHPEPIAKHLGPLFTEMETGQYQLGLATDGDADRIGAIDPGDHFTDPRFVDPHRIMTVILEYLVHYRGMRGSVVKTVSTTQMLNRLAERYGLPIHETPVGFNHISDLMMEEQVLIGGEESGGISILGHIPEGDGILMGLLLAEVIATHHKTLAQLIQELMVAPDVGPFCYARRDQPVTPFDKAKLVASMMGDVPEILAGSKVANVTDQDGVKFIMSDESWLLVRPSGTEPVLRIYAESRTDAQVQTLLNEGAALAEHHINQLEKSPKKARAEKNKGAEKNTSVNKKERVLGKS